MIQVSVHESKPFDPAVISRLLDDVPLPTQRDDVPAGPFLTLNGRVHRPTSDFLRSYAGARAESGTARRYASDLRSWLDFLCNVRGYQPHEDYRDPVFLASEHDFAAYWRRRQYGPDEHRLTSEGWKNARKAIKRFYEHAQRAYFHPPPFEIRAFETSDGYRGTKVAGYEPRRRRTGSAGKPLTPGWAEQLLMGALRVDLDGAQDDYAASIVTTPSSACALVPGCGATTSYTSRPSRSPRSATCRYDDPGCRPEHQERRRRRRTHVHAPASRRAPLHQRTARRGRRPRTIPAGKPPATR